MGSKGENGSTAHGGVHSECTTGYSAKTETTAGTEKARTHPHEPGQRFAEVCVSHGHELADSGRQHHVIVPFRLAAARQLTTHALLLVHKQNLRCSAGQREAKNNTWLRPRRGASRASAVLPKTQAAIAAADTNTPSSLKKLDFSYRDMEDWPAELVAVLGALVLAAQVHHLVEEQLDALRLGHRARETVHNHAGLVLGTKQSVKQPARAQGNDRRGSAVAETLSGTQIAAKRALHSQLNDLAIADKLARCSKAIAIRVNARAQTNRGEIAHRPSFPWPPGC